jgi:hypothetical protein
MTAKDFALILFSYLLLVPSLSFVVYLYADLFIFVADSTPDEGFNLFHLIITVPIPLTCAALLTLPVNRKFSKGAIRKSIIIKTFPFLSLIHTISQFIILSLDNSLFPLCIIVSIFLLVVSITLLINESVRGYIMISKNS